MVRKIHDLEPPALLLDIERAKDNIRRFQAMAKVQRVRLRPHGKTTKLPEIWSLQQEAGAKGLTVATVREAEVAAFHGINNILIALPYVDEKSLDRIRLLARENIITLLVSNEAGVHIVEEYFRTMEPCPNMIAAIDTGLHREGFDPEDPKTLEILKRLQERFRDKFVGITTHEGHSYKARSRGMVRQIARSARDIMIDLKERCQEAGVDIREVELGATPTFPYFRNDRKRTITEMHPGNYALMDYTQVKLGTATPEQCALSMLGSVIGSRVIDNPDSIQQKRKLGRLFIHPGGKGLSEAAKPHSAGGLSHGKLYDGLDARKLERHCDVRVLSEEIAWAEVPPSEIDLWKIGEKVRILVQHACPTMAVNPFVYIVDGDEVIDVMPVEAIGYRKFKPDLKH